MILDLILFLTSINLIASVYNAAFPAMILSREVMAIEKNPKQLSYFSLSLLLA